MPQLTSEGQGTIEVLAKRYGVSVGAVMTLLQALIEAQGRMAQFNHPELGGSGQWMRGGMTMVGDMFNNALKAKVDSLCSALSDLLAKEPFMAEPGSSQTQSQFHRGRGGYGETSLFVSVAPLHHWWPDELGTPASTGSQNNVRYAFFPAVRRLAIEINGQLTVYDTRDHDIVGVSQQQSEGASLTFISQHGLVRVAELPVVPPERKSGANSPRPPEDIPSGTPAGRSEQPPVPETAQAEDIFIKIERLAELRQKGVLSEEEFSAKKAELLSRL
jgi:hypothetical protein